LLGLAVLGARHVPTHGEKSLAVDRACTAGRIVLLYGYLVFCFWCYCFVG